MADRTRSPHAQIPVGGSYCYRGASMFEYVKGIASDPVVQKAVVVALAAPRAAAAMGSTPIAMARRERRAARSLSGER